MRRKLGLALLLGALVLVAYEGVSRAGVGAADATGWRRAEGPRPQPTPQP
jgi:hypothetical protein